MGNLRQGRNDPWWAALAVEPPARPAGRQSLASSSADLVVVGAGAAGLTAAVVAAEHGISVVVLEAGAQIGGTTYKSGGGYWIPNNSLMRARGKHDDRHSTLSYMASLSFPARYDAHHPTFGLDARDYELLATYFDTASEAVDALGQFGALRSREFQSFSGAYEGMVSYHSHLVEEFGRHLAPAAPDGEQQIGWSLVHQLHGAAVRLGVEIVVEHRVDGVITEEDGGVAGVTAVTPAGRVELPARHGVIFASGGFTHDEALIERHFRGPIYGGCAVSSNRGDFVRIGRQLGAELGNMANGWLVQGIFEAMLERRERDDMVFMPSGDSMIFVDATGRRAVNEKEMYQERTTAHFARDAEGNYPRRLLMMIFDEAVLCDRRPWSNPWPAGAAGQPYIVSGDTLGELSEALQERLMQLSDRTQGFALHAGFAEQLQATVERFNRFALAGHDDDFHRGESEHEIDWNRPAREGNRANPTMYPFAGSGPYHAVILCAGTLDTSGGPRIDARARVLRVDGQPIPRLYGAGNCIASPTAEAYWSGGSTIGPAITFAYIAATNIVAEAGVTPAVRELA